MRACGANGAGFRMFRMACPRRAPVTQRVIRWSSGVPAGRCDILTASHVRIVAGLIASSGPPANLLIQSAAEAL
jgi:hypothetical protein